MGSWVGLGELGWGLGVLCDKNWVVLVGVGPAAVGGSEGGVEGKADYADDEDHGDEFGVG